jgi:hypothetical protein
VSVGQENDLVHVEIPGENDSIFRIGCPARIETALGLKSGLKIHRREREKKRIQEILILFSPFLCGKSSASSRRFRS